MAARNHDGEQKGSRGKKCVAMKMVDRISELPDDVLLHILSFLPIYQVVQMRILSRRWRHLWTQIPVLDFRTLEPRFTRRRSIPFIDFCLLYHNAPKIKKFHARVNSTRIRHRFLYTWLCFALEHDVEELDMDYIDGNQDGDVDDLSIYQMPDCLFECGALRALRLRGCCLTVSASLCLGLLRTLELYSVICVPSDLNTSGFPLLESLTVHGTNSKSRLIICSPNQKLENLKICDLSHVLDEFSDLIIEAPYLLSIEISGYVREFGYSIKNLSSATHACLDFTSMFKQAHIFYEEYKLVKLLESLSHVKSLKLCQWSITDVALMEKPILENSPWSTTCLELGTSLSIWELQGMTRLLNNSHYLETLIIDIQEMIGYVRRNCDITESEGWTMLELAISSLLHLKTVRIYGLFCTTTVEASLTIDEILKECETEIKLLKVVLKSCTMLEKMFISVINTQDPIKRMLISESLLILTEELQNFPRVSANVEIYLS